jgi:hypothetical protein
MQDQHGIAQARRVKKMGAYDMVSSTLKLVTATEPQRESTRIPIHAKARIRTNGAVIEAEVENLSMNGAYVTSDKHIKINGSVVITIIDESTTSRTVFDIKAKVIWVIGNRVGLQFA